MAYWWQKEDHLPRVRLMFLQAEGMDTVHEVERTSLLAALEQWKPTTCPILLHASSAAGIDKVRPRLITAGWTVHAVVSAAEPAKNPEWLAEARQLVPETPSAPTEPTVDVESKPDPGSTADALPKAADETRIAPERGESAV
jgi:hypothetical protein